MSRHLFTNAALLATALTLASCAPSGDRHPAPPPATPSRVAPLGPSLYPLALPLRDRNDRAIALDVFRGHPVIVTMFYASCPSACPLTMTRIAQVERELAPEDRVRLRVLLVSFDPKHDTPEVLRATAEAHHVDERWELATGSESDVRALATALAIPYSELPNGGFSHGSVLVALDGDGRPVARVEGAATDTSPLVAAIQNRAGS